jgi:hypothetical protein
MSANVRLDSLYDLSRRRANLRVECGTCGKVTVFDAERLARYCLLRAWSTQLSVLGRQFVCTRCGARAAYLKPTPEQAGPDRFPKGEREWKSLYRRLRG